MNLADFVSSKHSQWDELDTLVRDGGSQPARRLGSVGMRRLGGLYRSASGDLAVARRRWPTDPLVLRLERSVVQARASVYGSAKVSRAIVSFFKRDFWRSVLERPACLIAATLMLFGPAVVSGVWGAQSPQQAERFVPSQYRAIGDPSHFENAQRNEVDAAESTVFASQIMTNNIRVTFLAFGGGLLLGLGTIFALLQNGMLLGVLSGLAIGAGNGRPFFELILPHGILELSCIVVGGAAGFRLASGILAPGHRPRAIALRDEAQRAVLMVVGVSLWLVVAGLVEGFITPQRVGFEIAALVGIVLGLAFWIPVVVLGRPERAPENVAVEDHNVGAQSLAESFILK